MTCIAAIVEKQKVFMSSDSCEYYRGCMSNCGTKIAIKTIEYKGQDTQMLIGTAGLSRVSELIKHRFTPPVRKCEVLPYLVGDFTNTFRDCLREAGALYKSNEEENIDYVALIGYCGKLYRWCNNYSIRECVEGFEVVGSGHIARALLYAIKDNRKMTPYDKLQKTQEYAAYHAEGVRPPFFFNEV